MSALRARGVVVPDLPPALFRFGLPSWPGMARTFEPYIAAGFSDAEAWDAIFDEEQRLRTFRAVYGNRKGKRKRKARSRQGSLL